MTTQQYEYSFGAKGRGMLPKRGDRGIFIGVACNLQANTKENCILFMWWVSLLLHIAPWVPLLGIRTNNKIEDSVSGEGHPPWRLLWWVYPTGENKLVLQPVSAAGYSYSRWEEREITGAEGRRQECRGSKGQVEEQMEEVEMAQPFLSVWLQFPCFYPATMAMLPASTHSILNWDGQEDQTGEPESCATPQGANTDCLTHPWPVSL